MSKYALFALFCMAAAGGASANVFKSVGSDGKVTYSDRPTDKSDVKVSIIKADIVQAIPVAKSQAVAAVDAGAVRLLALAQSAYNREALAKDGGRAPADAKELCERRVDVLVGRNGEIIKILGPSRPLGGFKLN
jgi:hypothetical protein